MTPPLRVTPRLTIPGGELHFSYVRSSGPGGQNVNKVASKALLRWSVVESEVLSEDLRQRIFGRYGRRISAAGDLLITSQRYRDQAKNRADCQEKLRALLLAVASPARPRKKTRPPKSAAESRLRDKRSTADKKRRRTLPRDE